MKKTKIFILTGITAVLSLCLTTNKLNAQETQEAPIDTIARSLHKLYDDLAQLRKIKVSGYIQAQFQIADSAGEASFAGGNFDPGIDKRFMIRRGRIKFNYDNRLTNYVLQFNCTEKEVRVKEAYVKFTEPWLEAVSLQMGIFDLPFGYEAPYSSGSLETPERGRMSQQLLPDENDIGAMLTFQMPKTSRLNFFKLEAGVFNGTQAKAPDFDYWKDFVGRLSIAKSTKSEKIKYGIGVSYYAGAVRQATSKVYTMVTDSAGLNAFEMDKDTTNYRAFAKRNYIGVDGQIAFDFPFGITTLRAEYIQGVQPGTSSSSKSPSADPLADTYVRSFNGAYLYFIQNIWKTKHQIVVKYDWYDPNTKVSGDELGKSYLAFNGKTFAKTTTQDVKFTTLGLGYNYHWDNNVKITLFYDMVTNEKSTNLTSKGYWKDVKDNVFTVRFQYKF